MQAALIAVTLIASALALWFWAFERRKPAEDRQVLGVSALRNRVDLRASWSVWLVRLGCAAVLAWVATYVADGQGHEVRGFGTVTLAIFVITLFHVDEA